jgi:hypothetical protein
MLSTDLKFLETAYDKLNKKFFTDALIRPVITIQKTPRTFGHFTCWNSWEVSGAGYPEINLGAEQLDRPLANTLATLLHEMVHQYCFVSKIKDTSSNGRYHNRRFKAEAEKRGLTITKGEGIGWSVTQPGEEFAAWVLSAFTERIKAHRCQEVNFLISGKAKSSTRKYLCPKCGLSVRATREVRIACVDCNCQLKPTEK